jgi:hypothetical protein
MTKRLLFWCGSLSSVQVLLRVADVARARGYEPVFVLGDLGGRAPAGLEAAVGGAGFAVRRAGDPVRHGRSLRGRHPHAARSWLLEKATLLLTLSLRPNPYLAQVKTRLARADRLLADVDPVAAVVSEDGISGPFDLLTAIRDRGVPLVDVPYGFGTRRDLELEMLRKAASGEAHHPTGVYGALVRRFSPHWISGGEAPGLLIFPSKYVVGLEAAGATLRDPWIIHGGFADRLCAESAVQMRWYEGEGIPPGKIVLTGSPYCDMMAESVAADAPARRALRSGGAIDPAALRVLVCWPPSYHESRGEASEFATYAEMTRRLLGFLTRLGGCSVTVSLHPAVDAATRDMVAREMIHPSTDSILSLIPRHDVMISYYSSTIRWAIAAGKPVVNFDAYGIGLPTFDGAPGVLKTRTFAEFRVVVERLVGDPAFREEVAARQAGVARDWGVLDGGCTQRVLDVVDEVSSRGRR